MSKALDEALKVIEELDDWKLEQISDHILHHPHMDFKKAEWRFNDEGDLTEVVGAVPAVIIH